LRGTFSLEKNNVKSGLLFLAKTAKKLPQKMRKEKNEIKKTDSNNPNQHNQP